jgi:hypothetical protein
MAAADCELNDSHDSNIDDKPGRSKCAQFFSF